MELETAPATPERSRGFLVSVLWCQNISVQSQRHDYYFRCLVLKYHWSGSGQHSITEDRGKEKTQPEKEREQGCVHLQTGKTSNLPRHSSSTSRGHKLLLNLNTEVPRPGGWCCSPKFSITTHSIPRILPLLFSALPR